MHVGRDHKHIRLLRDVLRPLYRHLHEFEYIRMIESLEEFDFAQGGDGKAILLVVHQNLLQCHDLTRLFRSSLGHFTKRTLAQLAQPFILLYFRASMESWLAIRPRLERISPRWLRGHQGSDPLSGLGTCSIVVGVRVGYELQKY